MRTGGRHIQHIVSPEGVKRGSIQPLEPVANAQGLQRPGGPAEGPWGGQSTHVYVIQVIFIFLVFLKNCANLDSEL